MPQGLSDFRKSELPKLGGMLEDRCPLYKLKKDVSVPGGAIAGQLVTAPVGGLARNHLHGGIAAAWLLSACRRHFTC